VVHGCYRGSRSASAAVATSIAYHRWVGTWRTAVDRFVAMSEFTRAKYVEAGYDGARIAVKPNFVTPDPDVGPGDGGFALFVGRLSPGKGIETLLRAWASLGSRLPLVVAGSGPLEPTVRQAADGVRVRWLGQRSAEEALELMGRARLLVFPSESFETFGRVVIEAFAKGTPVVAARAGAVAELVEDGRTGATFAPGDARDLVRQVLRVLGHDDPLALRAASRRAFEARYTAERNLESTLALYGEAIAVAAARSGRSVRGRGRGRLPE
jgi:glycosyltransferase involved in cell wall biosynthesis